MKLNKWQKQGIIQAIKDDIPEPDYALTAADFQTALVEAMSPEVRKVYKTHPKALKRDHFDPHPNRWYREFIIGDANVDEVIKPFHSARDKQADAVAAVAAVVNGCSTLKQLQAALPECIKYMPTEDAPSKNLPALANVVSDLVLLGWPKEKAAA